MSNKYKKLNSIKGRDLIKDFDLLSIFNAIEIIVIGCWC